MKQVKLGGIPTVRYWDYDSGSPFGRERVWGQTFPAVALMYMSGLKVLYSDEYDDAVTNGLEMFGQVAPGNSPSETGRR